LKYFIDIIDNVGINRLQDMLLKEIN